MASNNTKGFEGLKNRVEELADAKPRASSIKSKKTSTPKQTKKSQAAPVEAPVPKSETRWGMWACVIIGGIWLLYAIGNDNKRKIPEYVPEPAPMPYEYSAPTPVSQPAPVPIEDDKLIATKPTLGGGYNRTLSAGEMLYCFQLKEALDYIENRMTNNSQIAEYNTMVNNYNPLCGSFRYRQSDRTKATAAFNENLNSVHQQAQDWLDAWGKPSQSLLPAPANTLSSETMADLDRIFNETSNAQLPDDNMPRYPLCKPSNTEKSFSDSEIAAVRTVLSFGRVKPSPDTKTCTWPVKVLNGPGQTTALLTSEGEPGELCHGCGANLSIHLFSSHSTNDLLTSQWRFAQTGTWGDPGTITTVNLGNGRVGFAVENGETFQGYTTTSLEIYEITQNSVNQVLEPIILSRSDCGAMGEGNCENLEGKWLSLPDGTLQITYNGVYEGKPLINAENRYEFSRGKYVQVLGSAQIKGF